MQLKNPEDWKINDLATGTKKLPSDEITLKQHAEEITPAKFAEDISLNDPKKSGKFNSNYVYYVAWLLGMYKRYENSVKLEDMTHPP